MGYYVAARGDGWPIIDPVWRRFGGDVWGLLLMTKQGGGELVAIVKMEVSVGFDRWALVTWKNNTKERNN